MKKHSSYVSVSLIILLIIVMQMGCKDTNIHQSTFTLQQFGDSMKNKGYSFEITDVEEDFLPTTRKRMEFNHDMLDIYIFNGDKEMEEEAANIDKDGCGYTNGNKSLKVSWVSYPHFYKRGSLIVQYVGEDEKIITDLRDILGEQFAGYRAEGVGVDFVEAVSSKDVKEYYFEPNVSIIEGTLITRLHYGPPGYGEDPDNDEQEYPFILQLDGPIKVIAEDTDMVNSSISDVLEIQLVLRGSPYVDMAKQYKNKHIKVQGTLFSAFTGHHHTKVLMVVDKILD